MVIGQPFNPYQTFTGIFIPECLVKYRGITASSKICYGRLARYAGKDGEAYPSQETLAAEIGLDKRQCVRVLNMLEKEGFIRRIVPTGPDRWLHKTTHYVFLWHPVFDGPRTEEQPKKHGGNGDGLPDNIFEEQKFQQGERGNLNDPEAVDVL